MSDLLALAARVEALTGPCRETDGAIHLARHPKIYTYCGKPTRCIECRAQCRPNKVKRFFPAVNGGRRIFWYETLAGGMGGTSDAEYTASLDAAMTLVPDGWAFAVGNWIADDARPLFYADCANIASVEAHDGYAPIEGRAATPALALAAAALRARAAA